MRPLRQQRVRNAWPLHGPAGSRSDRRVNDFVDLPIRERLGLLEGEAFLARLEAVADDLVEAVTAVYGERTDVRALLHVLVEDALDAAASRPPLMAALDRRREVDP